MVIKKIKIKNFKTLKDFEIEPKPLTLLFGANSSGKSNFIRALLFFKKNVLPLKENTKDFRNGQLSYKLNESVDLISFDEIVTDGDIKQKISFEFILNFKYWFPENILEPIDRVFFFGGVGKNKEEYKNGFILNSNISVYFEFKKGDYKEYLNKISFKDLDKNLNIDFNIHENDFGVNLSGSELFQKVFNAINVKNNNLYSYLDLPFYEINNNKFKDDLKSYQKQLKGELGLNERQLTLEDSNKLKNVEDFRAYYLFSCLIPFLFQSFFSAIHFPQLREIPKKTYFLEEMSFTNKVYYNLLDSLYLHQTTLFNFMLKFKNKKTATKYQEVKYFAAFINKTIKIREKLSDKDIIDLFWIFEEFKEQFKIVNLKDILKFNNDLKEKKEKYYHLISKYEKNCNKSEQEFLFYLYKYNDLIKSIPTLNYYFCGEEYDPNFLRNISFNVNNMILRLGFYGILFVNKENDIAHLNLIKENNKYYNVVNESSGLLQILPILLGLSLLKESYDYSNEKKGSISFQGGEFYFETDFDFNKNFVKSIYIEQPELHLHPKLQSDFTDIVMSELKNFNLHNSILIETHSEHILKKIQIEIAKGNIYNNDVSINYFKRNGDGVIAENVGINEMGQLEKEFPDGFFDNSLDLSYEFYEAIKGKKIK